MNIYVFATNPKDKEFIDKMLAAYDIKDYQFYTHPQYDIRKLVKEADIAIVFGRALRDILAQEMVDRPESIAVLASPSLLTLKKSNVETRKQADAELKFVRFHISEMAAHHLKSIEIKEIDLPTLSAKQITLLSDIPDREFFFAKSKSGKIVKLTKKPCKDKSDCDICITLSEAIVLRTVMEILGSQSIEIKQEIKK